MFAFIEKFSFNSLSDIRFFSGSPWENGYIESFKGKMRDELLNGEIFDTMAEAKVLIERWRGYYNTIRPHSSLEYMPPAPEARVVDISLQMA